MSLKIITLGNPIAASHPPAAQAVLPPAPKTVLELLKELEGDKDYSMWRTVAQRLSESLKVPIEQLSLDALSNAGRSFRDDLIKRHYTKNSARSYSNYRLRLVARAKQLGWSPTQPELADRWKEISDVMPTNGSRRVIEDAIALNKAPEEFTDSDLIAYREKILAQGKPYRTAVRHMSSFIRALTDSALAHRLPHLDLSKDKNPEYGIPLLQLPSRLAADIEYVLQTKQKQYAPGRGKRIRLSTAGNTKSAFRRYCGFALHIAGCSNACDLTQLFTKELVVGYIDYLINKRGLKGYSALHQLSSMHAALKCHPAYKDEHFRWFASVISDIDPEPPQAIRDRKLPKYVDYELLLNMPVQMHTRRKEAEKLGALSLAWAIHDELLITWWVTFLWRQSNIRLCRLNKNLFRASIPPLVDMALPQWVQERIKSSPEEQLWQIHFAESETKTHRQVRSVVPRSLVPLIEEYVEKYRPLLLNGSDPTTLFLNRRGRALTSGQFTDLISKLTFEYVKRRVTPHLVRDIFAYWWLRRNPQDYLTLSKALWHSNIQTTIDKYGSKFDEAAALIRVENYREQRAKENGWQPHGATDAVFSKHKVIVVKGSGKPPQFGSAAQAA
jgi:hypothetical protein